MASIIGKATDKFVDTAQDVATTATDTVKNVTQEANEPTRLTPTPPEYTQSVDAAVKINAKTGADELTNDHPFIRLTEEDKPIRPGKDRLNPDVMRGRHHEFQLLASILEDPLPGPIHLIAGPPGYGKSTMLETVKRYAHRIGFITVEIEPKQFADTNTLVEHIRSTVLGEHMAPFHTQTSTGANTGGSASATINAKVIGAGANVQHNRHHGQTQERKGNPVFLANLRQIINLLREHAPQVRGLLFLCDEFQSISNTTHKDSKSYETARQNLYTLNEGFHRDEEKLPITTFLAGLTNAASTLDQLLTRPPDQNITELLPIDGYPVHDPDSTHCAQIIQDYIDAGQKAHGHQLLIHPRDLYRWGANCAGHVVYANQAGAYIQQQLQKWHARGKTTIQPEDIETLDRSIYNRRQTYYARRLKRISEAKPNDIGPQLNKREHKLALTTLGHIMTLIAQQDSLNQNENNPRFITWNAIQHIAENLHSDENVAQKCIDKLEAIGAIRKMQFPTLFVQYDPAAEIPAEASTSQFSVTNDQMIGESPHDPSVTPPTQHIAYVDCAIPSLTNYVLNQFPDRKSAMARMSEANQQALAAFNQYLTTRWPWTDKPALPMIPAYSTFTYNTPRTPAVLTPAQARARRREIDNVIREQHAHWNRTTTSLPWPEDMPQIYNNEPNQDTAKIKPEPASASLGLSATSAPL